MPDPTPIKRLEQRDQSGIHAGVDTVALKKNIAKDHAEHTADTQVLTNNKDIGPQEEKFRINRASETLHREAARVDSLDAYRKGKKP